MFTLDDDVDSALLGTTKWGVTSECIDIDECNIDQPALVDCNSITYTNSQCKSYAEAIANFGQVITPPPTTCYELVQHLVSDGICDGAAVRFYAMDCAAFACDGTDCTDQSCIDNGNPPNAGASLNGVNNCHSLATCINIPGSFECICKPGYTGAATTEGSTQGCLDLDECEVNPNICPETATCVNTVGSFDCVCNLGYFQGSTTCENINECAGGSNNCHEDAICIDLEGSFECTCATGYIDLDSTGIKGLSCANKNECADVSHDCDDNAVCADTQGSFTCTCNKGFSGIGTNCNDINECNNPSLNNCASEATCTNIGGSFTCACNSGFGGSGISCSDYNECRDPTVTLIDCKGNEFTDLECAQLGGTTTNCREYIEAFIGDSFCDAVSTRGSPVLNCSSFECDGGDCGSGPCIAEDNGQASYVVSGT